MNRWNDQEFENQFTDQEECRGKKRSGKPKLLISLSAVLTALIVAVVAVISVSAGNENTDEANEAFLTLSDGQTAEGNENALTGGFVLTDVSDVVDEVLPSVVSITSRSLVNYYGNSGFFGDGGNIGGIGDIWDIFFGDSFGGPGGNYYYYEGSGDSSGINGPENKNGEEPGDGSEEKAPEEIENGMGSGTIIGQNSEELLILTSYHVVKDCSSLYVTFNNNANVDGYIKAADAEKDIAVVAIPLADIDEETMNSIKIATISTEEPEVGEGCLVIGNALGYGISVTSGIVSKIDRQLYVDGRTLDVIQTDAPINFGNSGGCMVNAKGEIIGIAEAKTVISAVEGMCYAIPVARNLDLIQDLMNAEEPFNEEDLNVSANGGFLGIRGRDVTEQLSAEFEMPVGIYVSSVVPGSGAENAGIQSGDIIVGFGDDTISTMAELQYRLSSQAAGDTINLTINRLTEGKYESIDLEVTLTDRIS